MGDRKTEEVRVRDDDFGDFMTEFISESDRAAVILGAARVEALLGQILEKFLLPCVGSKDELLEGDAPLSTLSSRIKICHRLGIIDDQFAQLLNTFRRLRNGFAHEVTHSSLSVGSARDRVASMADAFEKAEFLGRICSYIGGEMERDPSDPGVVFRAVMGIFHLELSRIQGLVRKVHRADQISIVDHVCHLRGSSKEIEQ